MLDELLRKVKSQGYTVGQIVMNHDTSANAIVCTHFPDIHITYCNNHSAKSFRYELSLLVVSIRRKDQFEYTAPTGFRFLEVPYIEYWCMCMGHVCVCVCACAYGTYVCILVLLCSYIRMSIKCMLL